MKEIACIIFFLFYFKWVHFFWLENRELFAVIFFTMNLLILKFPLLHFTISTPCFYKKSVLDFCAKSIFFHEYTRLVSLSDIAEKHMQWAQILQLPSYILVSVQNMNIFNTKIGISKIKNQWLMYWFQCVNRCISL